MDIGYLSVLSSVVLTLTLLFCSRAHAHVANQVTTQSPLTTTIAIAPEIQSASAAVRTLESKQALALLANFLVARLTSHLQPRQTSPNTVTQQEAAVYYPPSYNYGYYGYNGQPNVNTNGHHHNGNGHNAYYGNGYPNYAVNGYGTSGYGNGYYYPPQPADQTPLDPESNDELERTMAAFNSIEDSSARGTRFNPFPVISQQKQFSQFQGAMGQSKFNQRQEVIPGTPITGTYGYAVSSGGSSYG